METVLLWSHYKKFHWNEAYISPPFLTWNFLRFRGDAFVSVSGWKQNCPSYKVDSFVKQLTLMNPTHAIVKLRKSASPKPGNIKAPKHPISVSVDKVKNLSFCLSSSNSVISKPKNKFIVADRQFPQVHI